MSVDSKPELFALDQMNNQPVNAMRKKVGPLLKTLKRAQLEEILTTKGKATGRFHEQQKEHNQNNADMSKTRDGTGDGRRNNNKEGENTNMG